jgi:hypothetical protein
LTATRYSPNSNDSDDSDDNDGFIDIDDFLSDVQQKSVPASADPNSGGIAEMVDNGTRGGSPTNSSRSTAGSSRGKYTAFLQFGRDFLLI